MAVRESHASKLSCLVQRCTHTSGEIGLRVRGVRGWGIMCQHSNSVWASACSAPCSCLERLPFVCPRTSTEARSSACRPGGSRSGLSGVTALYSSDAVGSRSMLKTNVLVFSTTYTAGVSTKDKSVLGRERGRQTRQDGKHPRVGTQPLNCTLECIKHRLTAHVAFGRHCCLSLWLRLA